MELFKLFGTIAVNGTDEAKSNIESVSNSASATGERLQEVGSAITGVGAKITKGVAAIGTTAVAAGASVYAFASKAASAGDTVDKMSQKIGVSREAYQELDFILSQSGTSVDTMQAGMKTLTTAMDGVFDGTSKNVEEFKRLGVSVLDADGKLRSQEDVMWETMAALQGMENQTEKARLAQELFGRSGTELMPLLNSEAGSIEEMRNQAHELGLIMSDEAVNASVEFTDKMDQTKRALAEAGNEIGITLIPYLIEFANWIQEHMPQIREAIGKVAEIIGKVAEKVGELISWFQGLSPEMQNTIKIIAGIVVAAGPLLMVIGTIISSIGSVITIVGTMGAVLTTGGTILTALGAAFGVANVAAFAIIAVIAAVVAIGIALYKNWDTIKEKCTSIWNGIKTTISNVANAVHTTVTNVFNKVKEAITQPIEKAKEKVKSVVDTIKNFFSNMKLSLPHIKLPHFSITGKLSLAPPSIPKLSIDWYKKAMDEPYLFTEPTVFGMNGSLKGAGEAGDEMIYGHENLMHDIENASGSVYLQEKMNRIIELLEEFVGFDIRLDSGALVGGLAPAMDVALGDIYDAKGRGGRSTW